MKSRLLQSGRVTSCGCEDRLNALRDPITRDFPFGYAPSVHPASDTYFEPELVRFVGRLSLRRSFTLV